MNIVISTLLAITTMYSVIIKIRSLGIAYDLKSYILRYPLYLIVVLLIMSYFFFSNRGIRRYDSVPQERYNLNFNTHLTTKDTDSYYVMVDETQDHKDIKDDAINFYNRYFGLPKWYIKNMLYSYIVSDGVEYFINNKRLKAKEFGYICYAFPLFKFKGEYGGRLGVINSSFVNLHFGYIQSGSYKIRYSSASPLKNISTFGSEYTPIDNDIIMNDTLKGKMIGMLKKTKTTNRENLFSMSCNLKIF